MTMPSRDDFSVPDDFRAKVIERSGENGKRWLQELPDRLSRCRDEWRIRIEGPVQGLSFNYVAAATTEDGREVILKVGCPDGDLFGEMVALKAFAEKKVAKLLRWDAALGALLLQKLHPGLPLGNEPQDDEKATRIVAELIRDFPIAVPAEGNFVTYKEWTAAFERVPKDFPELGMVSKAKELVRDMEATKTEDRLLHGDLHHHNILFDDKEGWTATDPKGVIGDPAAEAGRMLHNPRAQFLKTKRPGERAEERIEILADVTKLEADRLKKWGYIDCMLSAAWNVNRDYRIKCARVFEAIGA
jgi:streptomycin 6-kinase